METIETLVQLGFTPNEARVYMALLSLGESSVQPIAKKANLPRTYCYDILAELIEKGFVSYVERRGRRRYSATEPRIVKKFLLDQVKIIDPILPTLEGLYQKAPFRPKVRFFEGREGVRAIYEEMVQEAKEEMIIGSGEEWARNFHDWYEFTAMTVKKGIKIRDLAKRMPESEKWGEVYKKPLQELRFIRKEWVFPSDQFIWGNKVAVLHHGAEMYGLVIESREFARSMKTLFEILWPQAESK